MPQTLICARGHTWEATGSATSVDTSHSTTCPICGSAADRDTVSPSDAESKTGRDPNSTLLQADTRPEIPGFELLGELGRGGMGVVYRARQRSLDRIVALKMLLSGPLADGEDLSRLRSEAESIARMAHPNIVHVYDIGEHKGWTYISLEYLDGGNLAKTLNGQPRSPQEAAQLVETLARAVHAAHQRGVVHRDLKPANVLLTSEGIPKITDFGLAKRIDLEAGQTRTGAVMGTPSYMAPEQAEGKAKSVGPATDVYALGAILYELLTGRPPFQSDSAFGVMLQVVNNSPAPPRQLQPGLPSALEQICLKCLRKNPEDRYPSALILAEELKRFGTHASSAIGPATAIPPSPPVGSNRMAAWAVGLLALAGLSFLIYQFAGRKDPSQVAGGPGSGHAAVPPEPGKPPAGSTPTPSTAGVGSSAAGDSKAHWVAGVPIMLWARQNYSWDCPLHSEVIVNGESLGEFSSNGQRSLENRLKLGWNSIAVKTTVAGSEKESNSIAFRIGPVNKDPDSKRETMEPVLWQFDNGTDWKHNAGKYTHRLGPDLRTVTVNYNLYFAGSQHELARVKEGDYVLTCKQEYNWNSPISATVTVNETQFTSFLGNGRTQLVITPFLHAGKNQIQIVTHRVKNLIENNDFTVQVGGPAEYSATETKFVLAPVINFKAITGWTQDKKSGQWLNEADSTSDKLERTLTFVLDKAPNAK